MKLSFSTRKMAFAASGLALLVLTLNTAIAAPTSNAASYSLGACIVSGEDLGGDDMVVQTYDGREVRFCCKMCVKDFEKDQASFLQGLDQAVAKAQLADYPLRTCVVSGEVLGGKTGEAIDHVEGNRLVRLCSESCRDDLTADPATYLKKLDAAVVEAQLKDYPADTCPISGQKLGGMGDPYNYVFAGNLVRFCCSGCIDTFDEDPLSAMVAIYEGASSATEAREEHEGHEGHDGHNH